LLQTFPSRISQSVAHEQEGQVARQIHWRVDDEAPHLQAAIAGRIVSIELSECEVARHALIHGRVGEMLVDILARPTSPPWWSWEALKQELLAAGVDLASLPKRRDIF
jgi:hypothetical protein